MDPSHPPKGVRVGKSHEVTLWEPVSRVAGTSHRLVGPEVLAHVEPFGSGGLVTIDIFVTDSRPKVTRVELVGGDLDSADLRSISLPDLVRNAMAGEVRLELLWNGEPTATVDLANGLGTLGLPDEVVWSYGRLLGLDPTKYLAEVAGITRSAAAQRIRRARQAGDLPPATRGER